MQISSEGVKVGHPDIVADVIAANATTNPIAEHAIAARTRCGQVRVPGHAGRARVSRTFVAVVRIIGVVGSGDLLSETVAHHKLAIAGNL